MQSTTMPTCCGQMHRIKKSLSEIKNGRRDTSCISHRQKHNILNSRLHRSACGYQKNRNTNNIRSHGKKWTVPPLRTQFCRQRVKISHNNNLLLSILPIPIRNLVTSRIIITLLPPPLEVFLRQGRVPQKV
eukprot:PhF_6_TR37453/c0_g1_i1/m.55090